MPTYELPCVICGRTVSSAVPRPLPRCARCAGGFRAFDVRVGKERVQLDRDALRARLAAGTLAGTDFVLEAERYVPLAAHPELRTFFLPGHPDAVDVRRAVPERARAPVAWARWLGIGVVVLVAGGGVAVIVPPLLAPAPRPAPPVAVAPVEPAPAAPGPVGAASAATAPVPAPAPVAGPLELLITRVGPVTEAPEVLLAQARAAVAKAEDLPAAEALAERAFAAAPEAPDALALLAELVADSGGAADLRDAALARAQTAGPTLPSVRRAAAIVALAGGNASEARRLADQCLADTPADLGCRDAQARAREAADPKGPEVDNLLYALDELARAWPENRAIPRRAALLAARTDVLGAEARLDAQAARAPQDAGLAEARARLAFRNGRSNTARTLLGAIPTPSPDLLIEAAGDAVGRGRGGEALDFLQRVPAPASTATARLYEAQARWLVARATTPADPTQIQAALSAARRAAQDDPGNPAVVQVRLATSLLARDFPDAVQAWQLLDPKGGTPVDQARAWVMRASMDLSQDHPREALTAMEAAVAADTSDPSSWLWLAQAHTSAQNGLAAAKALREAVVSVDGRHARRRAYGGALPVPADAATLGAALTALLASDPARQDDLGVSRAAIAWLSGDDATALTDLAPVLQRGVDADAAALRARLLLARGDAAEALSAVDAALSVRPKEAAFSLLRAEVLGALGRGREAETALATARSGGAPVASVELTKVRLALKARDAAGALVASRAAYAADPTDLVARRALRGVSED